MDSIEYHQMTAECDFAHHSMGNAGNFPLQQDGMGFESRIPLAEVTIMATPQQAATMIARLQGILADPHTSKVNLVAGSLRIDPAGFQAVSNALGSGSIVVDIEPMPPGVNARYSRTENKIILSSENFGGKAPQNSAIVHEFVHAITDLRNLSKITFFEDEAAAYIVQFVYFLYAVGQSRQTFAAQVASGELKLAPFETKACRIANFLIDNASVAVPSADFTELQTLVSQSPVYAGRSITDLSGANGVP